jgi:hypothetical protein
MQLPIPISWCVIIIIIIIIIITTCLNTRT